MTIMSWEFESPSLHIRKSNSFKNFFAEIAQLVEHNLAKVGVASSSLVFRSQAERQLKRFLRLPFLFFILHSSFFRISRNLGSSFLPYCNLFFAKCAFVKEGKHLMALFFLLQANI